MPAPAEPSESPKTPPKFDLGSFVVLPENRSAVRAVRTVARAASLGKRAPVSPLVLHGPPGSGKSHLCRAALAALMQASPGIVVRFESAGDLARPDVLAEDTGFGDRGLFTCDALVLEDVQHLPERAADGVCELLDHRTRHRTALIVTTVCSPAELTGLPKRLTSRLVAGLTVRLEPLGVAGRRKVLGAAARARNVRLTPDALDWLANRVGGLRPALGALQNLAQVAPQYPGPLDATTVERTLAETGQPTSGSATVDAIIKRVIAAFGITERALLGPSRLRSVLVPRQVAMYLARELVGLSLPRIGAAFGRDHTTVLHACRKIEGAVKQDAALDSRVRQLRGELG
ncbi:DnaA/Hda family protein [Gemmata sp.]|uniref:DnaA/Hda family protein n=1 Tax=Gemmata sp. TaxID=1914242 RepID=UPI003F70FD48